jgi:hypothetical protein
VAKEKKESAGKLNIESKFITSRRRIRGRVERNCSHMNKPIHQYNVPKKLFGIKCLLKIIETSPVSFKRLF